MGDTKQATKLIRGKMLRAYFENIVASERHVDPEARERLVNRLQLFITSARFRAIPPEVKVEAEPAALRSAEAGAAARDINAGLEAMTGGAGGAGRAGAATAKGKPAANGAGTGTDTALSPGATAPSAASVRAARGGAFDPYAFSAEAMILRDEEDALRRELNEVGDRGNLQALAKAQKLSLPRELRTSDDATLAELRDAIIEAAKKRVANRQAAAG